tara:strand:+ start:174 stop:563 length:390 start_codon:yes stop_codon:yes gene_type:complete
MKRLLLILAILGTSCGDDYITMETRIINSESKVPMYFWCDAMPNYDTSNTWYPEFTYYVYQLEEGEYDAYFHAYLITDDSVAWSATEEIVLENGKKILGHYSGVNTAFIPGEDLGRTTPMAYVSIRHNE